MRRRLVGSLAVAVALGVAGCGSTSTGTDGTVAANSASSGTTTSSVSASGVITADYLPGLRADMRLPSGAAPAPLIVLVPGGGWQSADPTGLVPMAEELTKAGASTVTMTYSTTAMGATFPVPVDDVVCAVRWSAQEATRQGRPPSKVVVLGHSAGGHLAALAAMSGDHFGGGCPAPAVRIDGLIGMAGVYDVRIMEDALAGFFGSSSEADPALWDEGDPLWWAANGDGVGDLRVLLIHGDADTAVPLVHTNRLAEALRAAGADVTVDVVPGQSHLSIFEADVAVPLVQEWLDGWS